MVAHSLKLLFFGETAIGQVAVFGIGLRTASFNSIIAKLANSIFMKKYFLSLCLIFLACQGYSVVVRHDKNLVTYTEYAQQPKFDCVGYFKRMDAPDTTDTEGGTCVAIGPRYILTAAHCFIISDTKEEKMNLGGKIWTVYQPYNTRLAPIEGYEFVINGKKLKGKKLYMHPKYFVDTTENPSYDLAIVELTKPIDGIASFPRLYDKLDKKGKTGTFVGFGTSGSGDSINTEDLHLKIAGKNVIDSMGGENVKGNFCKLMADFDEPNNNINPTALYL
ncbi:MAG: trypsin-like serine protease [Edaphocola sp.]